MFKVCIRCALLRIFPASKPPVESSLSSIIFDGVEEHDSEDSFFYCGETDTITKDTRTVHDQKLTWLIATKATDERMVFP